MSPDLKMGMCCICLMEHPTVRNVIMLDKRAIREGTGCWGCFQCGLPMAGAIAVLCDDCLAEYQEDRVKIALACVGAPKDNQRVPLSTLTEPFEHDMSKHVDEEVPDE